MSVYPGRRLLAAAEPEQERDSELHHTALSGDERLRLTAYDRKMLSDATVGKPHQCCVLRMRQNVAFDGAKAVPVRLVKVRSRVSIDNNVNRDSEFYVTICVSQIPYFACSTTHTIVHNLGI